MKSIMQAAIPLVFSATDATAQASLGWGVHGNAAQVAPGDSLGNVYGWGFGGGGHRSMSICRRSVFDFPVTTRLLHRTRVNSKSFLARVRTAIRSRVEPLMS